MLVRSVDSKDFISLCYSPFRICFIVNDMNHVIRKLNLLHNIHSIVSQLEKDQTVQVSNNKLCTGRFRTEKLKCLEHLIVSAYSYIKILLKLLLGILKIFLLTRFQTNLMSNSDFAAPNFLNTFIIISTVVKIPAVCANFNYIRIAVIAGFYFTQTIINLS